MVDCDHVPAIYNAMNFAVNTAPAEQLFMATTESTESNTYRLGAVSYLNSRPLIEGLDRSCGVSLCYDVPARLPGMLEAGEVDAALVPVIDLLRPGRMWKIVSNACIGCDGETLTVRIFSRVPPDEIQFLHVDGDSHTSVALAAVIWAEMFDKRLMTAPLTADTDQDSCEAILLIGDKVVNHRLIDFDIEIDLGGAWKSLTGLPFVFAVWAAQESFEVNHLARLLEQSRDRGVAEARRIALDCGPGLGWPQELAVRYLTQRLRYTITDAHREALRLFTDMVRQANIVPDMRELAL